MPVRLQYSVAGEDGRREVWCPSLKHPVRLLRALIEDQLGIELKLIFNGQMDAYKLEDYSICPEDVIHVMQNSNQQREVIRADAELLEESEMEEDPPETLSQDEWYSVGDHIDAFDQTGAWYPGRITRIESDNHYSVIFNKPSLGGLDRIPLAHIRPQSCRPVARSELRTGMSVMANIEPSVWKVALIERISHSKLGRSVKVSLSVVSEHNLSQHSIKFQEALLYHLEQNVMRQNRSDSLERSLKQGPNQWRYIEPDCPECLDRPDGECSECGCQICEKKSSPSKQLICDECDRPTHLWCLREPLRSVPKQSHWYCDQCRNESQQEIEIQNRIHLESKTVGGWRFGMTCTGRTPGLEVAKPKFGQIESVPVGSWWRFRFQASEEGVHIPLVAGIHGKESQGAYSIVYSGLFEQDADLGDDVYYTASGGRNSKPRTGGIQVRDQKLKRANKALALNCWAPFDGANGANAGSNWRLGKPVRLLRSGNARQKNSRYLPKVGVRYDGIYKVVKYWPERANNLITWRFHLKRDDPAPAPWTEAARYLARKHGIQLKYPPGWCKVLAPKRYWSLDRKFLAKKRKTINRDKNQEDRFEFSTLQLELIEQDRMNSKTWEYLREVSSTCNHEDFLSKLKQAFTCAFCIELAKSPITTDCGHNFCADCIVAASKANVNRCPNCRATSFTTLIQSSDSYKTNQILQQIFSEFGV